MHLVNEETLERSIEMYKNILIKDLKRKKTMNVILFIFIILASTFISGSINNMISVTNALDNYFEMSRMPDYFFSSLHKKDVERFEEFARENDYDYSVSELLQVNPADILIDKIKFDYSNTIVLSELGGKTKVFNSDASELVNINDGEVYMPSWLSGYGDNDFKIGNCIEVSLDGKTKKFTIKGFVKDVVFGSPTGGIGRFLISDNDYNYFRTDNTPTLYSVSILTNDKNYLNKFMDCDINAIFSLDRMTIRRMYILDILITAVILVVSVSLILISMVILRFTINFTMIEEYREIGVMKAIGIKCSKIRLIYIVKYLFISFVGSAVGLILSIPFGKMMLAQVSKNIIISSGQGIYINIICTLLTAATVTLFCFLCTRKIKNIYPLDAIRNGKSGERFSRKNIISLGKSNLSPVLFMALNDILCGIRRFISMIVIFALGLLLIIIPMNVINTLQSDNIIKWFNMSPCDNVIAIESLFKTNGSNKEMLNNQLEKVRKIFTDENISAKVFQEIMFRMTIENGDKKMSSIAFQGIGEVSCDDYTYIEGTAPQNENEIALTRLVCDKISADIGDTVSITNGGVSKDYIITATYQSMNNLGEGIRFFENADIDYNYAGGSFGIQIKYNDNPSAKQLKQRRQLILDNFKGANVYTSGEYVNIMIGDMAGQINSIKQFIVIVVAAINILVTVLMVKSFITKERSDIAVLKAVGFNNSAVFAWHTIRITIVLIISILFAEILQLPLSKIIIEPVFKIMGAETIEFTVKPLDVYFIYPLIILIVTTCSAFIASLNTRKVYASETSDIV